MRRGMEILRRKLLNMLAFMRDMCLTYKDLPTLGFTHFQPAQLTTFFFSLGSFVLFSTDFFSLFLLELGSEERCGCRTLSWTITIWIR